MTKQLEWPVIFFALAVAATATLALDLFAGASILLAVVGGFAIGLASPAVVVFGLLLPMAMVEMLRNARKPVAFCPQCQKKLKTAEAKQCFTCGADWH